MRVYLFFLSQKMDSNIVDKISAIDFNAEKYVREISQRWVGGQELQQQRKAVQALSENTNILLKKNVYENYTQFIETAKEITHLESEMYQLSHLLTEQRSLLDAVYNSNIRGDIGTSVYDKEKETEKSEEQRLKEEEETRRRKLTAILEKVEGCSGLLEVKGRTLIHEGDLMECDPVGYAQIQKVRAYLFNDALMLATWITKRRGPARYKMYKLLDIASLAIVNVRESEVKHAFKILIFPDPKLFACPSTEAQREWLDKIDSAKKHKLTSEKAKRETVQSQSSVESLSRPTNPFDKELIQSQTSVDSPTTPWEESEQKTFLEHYPDWFIESPEELDVFVAERHFENALGLLNKTKDFCKAFPAQNDSTFIDISKKIEARRKTLTEALVKELEVSPDKSLQGGVRAARQAVRLLIALGRQTQACDLLLQLCTSIMKKELKCVKREGSSTLYVKRLGHQFYSTLLEVASEFTRVFANAQTSMAALVIWTDVQLAQFVGHVVKQVFIPQVPLSTVAECVSSLRSQNEQLSDCGMDLRYQMEGILLKPVTLVLQDAKEKALEALKHRASEDKWHLLNLNNRANLNKLLQELKDLGVVVPQPFIRGECWLELTGNTVAFTRMYLSLLDDCCKLHSQHLHHVIEDVLCEVLRAQLKIVEAAIHSHTQESEVQVIHKNATFIIDHLLDLIEHVYQKQVGIPSAKLTALAAEYHHLKMPGGRPRPAPRQASVSKYSSEEFI